MKMGHIVDPHEKYMEKNESLCNELLIYQLKQTKRFTFGAKKDNTR